MYKNRRARLCILCTVLLVMLSFSTEAIKIYMNDGRKELTVKQESENDFGFRFHNGNYTFRSKAPIDGYSYYFINEEKELGELDFSKENRIQKTFPVSFGAVRHTLEDINEDGVEEELYYYAKADTDETQGYFSKESKYGSEIMHFELVREIKELLHEYDTVLYLDGEALSNQQVTIKIGNGKEYDTYTDEYGKLKGIRNREMRKGIQLTYEQDGVIYVFSYLLESYALFTNSYWKNLSPVLVLFGVSIVFIVIGVLVRYWRDPRTWDKPTPWKKAKGKQAFWQYSKVRRAIQLFFLVVITYGYQLFGVKITQLQVPVFSCGWNEDQFVICGVCYPVSHLSLMATEYQKTITEYQSYMQEMSWSILTLFIWAVLFTLGIFVFVFLFGRLLCGFVCPMGTIQDIISDIRKGLHIKGADQNEKNYKVYHWFRFIILLIFIGIGFFGIDYCHLCPAAVVTAPAFSGFRLGIYASGITGIIAIVGSFFKERFWCNICPLGYLVGLFHKGSFVKLKKDCGTCTECGACYEACPMGIKNVYEEREKGQIDCAECLLCGKCVKKCPEEHALAITFLGKEIYVSSRNRFFGVKAQKKKEVAHGTRKQ